MPLLGMRLLSLFLTCLVTRRKESPSPESLDVTAKKCRLSSRLLSRLYSTERSVLSFPRSLALSLPFTHSATQPAIARLASCKGRERTRERERDRQSASDCDAGRTTRGTRLCDADCETPRFPSPPRSSDPSSSSAPLNLTDKEMPLSSDSFLCSQRRLQRLFQLLSTHFLLFSIATFQGKKFSFALHYTLLLFAPSSLSSDRCHSLTTGEQPASWVLIC